MKDFEIRELQYRVETLEAALNKIIILAPCAPDAKEPMLVVAYWIGLVGKLKSIADNAL